MPDPRRHAGSPERSTLSEGVAIHRISLPTPWQPAEVNVYLIESEPLTLVDTGPWWPPAAEALDAALASHSRRVEDLKRIVLTHQHLDHVGQAHALVARSGADLCALDGVGAWMATYPASLAAEDRLADLVLQRHGAGEGILRVIHDINAAVHPYGEQAAVTTTLADGETLAFADRVLEVHHLPGHSPSDTVFRDPDAGLLLAGDVLLGDRRSTAIIAPPLDGSEVNVRPRALMTYLESLRALAAMDVELVLPGHGDPFSDHRALIADRLARYDATTQRIAALLDGEPRTASALALAFRGAIPERASFFVLCEMLGHLDRLVDAGAAVETDEDGIKRFARAV